MVIWYLVSSMDSSSSYPGRSSVWTFQVATLVGLRKFRFRCPGAGGSSAVGSVRLLVLLTGLVTACFRLVGWLTPRRLAGWRMSLQRASDAARKGFVPEGLWAHPGPSYDYTG